MVRVPRSYDYTFPRKKLLGALRSALAAKFADGKLIVVNAFDVKEPKTKEFRKSLDTLKVDYDGADRRSSEARESQSGIELAQYRRAANWCASNEVHPYHLLRYDRVIFSQPAIEKLQVSLKTSVSKRQRKAEEDEGAKKAHGDAAATARNEKAAEVA